MTSISNPIQVAAVQAAPVFLDKKKTVEKACALISEASRKGAKLVVFSEVFISGYPDWVWLVPNSNRVILDELYHLLIENAVTIPDQSTRQLCQAAKKAGVNVVIGIHERNAEASNASLYNTSLYIRSDGQILGKHRKLIPTGGERLIWAGGDGSTLKAFDTSVGKLGGLICWENYMPLARQAMYEQGVQIHVAPTWDSSENWLQRLRYIAREGGMFVIGCCTAMRMSDIPERYEFKKLYPAGKDWINPGNSCIIDPQGNFIAGPVKASEEILYASIDFKQISAAKRMFDAAGHYARPDVFTFGVNQESGAV